MTSRLFLLASLLLQGLLAQGQSSPTDAMHALPDEVKFTVSQPVASVINPPTKWGWYCHSVGVVEVGNRLVAAYRQTDFHTANVSDIIVCDSEDGGKTWKNHRSIGHADVWNEGGIWVAPQLSKLRDGRLVVICDFGHRTPSHDHPMLSQWQMPNRGMSNHLFWSHDGGKTWTAPQKIDNVGGEPGYIVELSDGTLMFTRTQSKPTDQVWNAPLPWGNNYYYNEAVFSDDGGKTWPRTATIADDPQVGDCEVGTVELTPNRLLAVTRVGLGNGTFGQPSRLRFSNDKGRTWTEQALCPFYAQRPIVRKLHSGKLLMTYRNMWGTPATYAVVFGADEKLPYQPASFIWNEANCTLRDGAMTIQGENGIDNLVTYALYPAQAPDSRVELSAELRVERADPNGCNLSAGCWVRIEPARVSLADRPADGFALDATQWHQYRIVREGGEISVYVDGELKLKRPTAGLETRLVHFGNRKTVDFSFHNIGQDEHTKNAANAGLSHWRSVSAKVDNRRDLSIDWRWNASEGYPDQFRRDRIVQVDKIPTFNAHCGYSGWTQTADGRVVIADYTVGAKLARLPFIRAYLTSEQELSPRLVASPGLKTNRKKRKDPHAENAANPPR